MFHTCSISKTLGVLESSEEGLSKSEVEQRRQKYGLNTLPQKRALHLYEIFLLQFKSPIIYILLIAAVVTFVIEEYVDGYFIMAVLLLNAIIGTYQEYSAAIKAEGLKKAIKTEVQVLRGGKLVIIESEKLTVGDIVRLESGTKIPADLRLIRSSSLMVNESLLTGESLEVNKEAHFISDDNVLPVAERMNMLYAGSYVASGRADGVVTAIATETEIGRIAVILASSEEGKAPLAIRMERLSMTIAKAVGIVVALLFAIGLFKGMGLYELFFFSVALAVSAIPEGLPVAITVALTSASLVMSKRNVIVRKLSAIEALGSCTMIASDKTGTLTKNQLSVEHFIPKHKDHEDNAELVHVTRLASVLCSEMTIEKDDADVVNYIGDQVDVALARHAISADEAYILAVKEHVKVDEIPYEPQNRYSAVQVEHNGHIYEFVKGSPETILEFCDVTQEQKQQLLGEVDSWADKGYRNIALAYKMETGEKIALENFLYLGFMAIIDPIREESEEAVATAKDAGINTIMVTGDHPNTAFYIAKQLGIAQSEDEVIEGAVLSKWCEGDKDPQLIADKTVFSRVSPEQKKSIVEAFQKLGHFVAVTGDGVNDAPALKFANIGIAMGESGTDIARNSADLILTDDNFASIINGIEEGRRAYDNIRKVVYLLVSTGFAEIVLVMMAFVSGFALPLLPVQLLWLNLVTNGLQDVMLGLEKAERGILKRRPRPPSERIFNPLMLRRILVGGLYIAIMSFIVFVTLLQLGYSEYSARNATLLLMVLFENVHVFNARSEHNFLHKVQYRGSMYLILLVLFTQLLHISCMYIPSMQHVLSVEPVSLEMWLTLFVIALGLVVVMELQKYVVRYRNRAKE
ncbi:MAG: cation-transporting P-type ATPase [Campylobacterota bacterium]